MQAFPEMGPEWPAVVGFDFFDVDRLLSFGVPPEDAIVLGGRFEPAAIVAAHEARGFSGTDQGETTLICSEAGCDEGFAMDMAGREPADPFGGMMGRKQPLVVSGDALLSSASFEVITAMQAAADGSAGSLAEAPEVIAAVAALTDDAILRQAALASRDLIGGTGSADAPALPPYDMLLFADTATSTEQIAHVVLVYPSIEDANAAAEALPLRMAEVGAGGRSGSIRTQLENAGLTAADISVLEAPDGVGATVDVALHAPLAGADETSMDSPSSGLYARLISNLAVLDAGWLVPVAS
jgi:hypothetical protein